jgi:hypothetical protein
VRQNKELELLTVPASAQAFVRPIVSNMRRLRRLDLFSSMQRSVTIQLVRPWIARRLTMKMSMVTVVVLLVVTFAFWIGQAEAQQRGGKGMPAGAPPRKGGARPAAGKMSPPQPKGKAQQHSKGGMAKAAAQNKQKPQDSVHAKHDEKTKHAAKEKAREHVKKAEMKPVAAGGGPDHESISLLHAVHHKLQIVNHDYGVHRRRASDHVGSALRHLGSSAQAPIGLGKGQVNSSQPVSDAIMHEARAGLEMIRNLLAARTAAAAGHGEARGAVDAAIREIDLALNIR